MDDADEESSINGLKVVDSFSLGTEADSSTAIYNKDERPAISEVDRFTSELNTILKKIFLSDDETILSLPPKTQKSTMDKRVRCKLCSEKYHPSFADLHKTYYCRKPLKELGLTRIGPGNVFQCIRCEEERSRSNKTITSIFYENYNLAMFHARYLCGLSSDSSSDFRCIFCHRTVAKKEFLLHARQRHGKNLDHILSFVEVLLAENIKA